MFSPTHRTRRPFHLRADANSQKIHLYTRSLGASARAARLHIVSWPTIWTAANDSIHRMNVVAPNLCLNNTTKPSTSQSPPQNLWRSCKIRAFEEVEHSRISSMCARLPCALCAAAAIRPRAPEPALVRHWCDWEARLLGMADPKLLSFP